jgi:hypothetical protein
MNTIMKPAQIALFAALLAIGSALAQDKTPNSGTNRPAPPETLTKFDLDFKGGHPKDLVAAIQDATGKTLNVLIPENAADVNLPELKMKNVNALQLFKALDEASRKSEFIKNPDGGSYSSYNTGYGFRADGENYSDNTIWYFYVLKPNIPPRTQICRFYALAPYLDWGISIDDITTAIKTGAKMLGENGEPTMSFHKDTRLLIAVGEPRQLDIIDSVLMALKPPATASVWNIRPGAKADAQKP